MTELGHSSAPPAVVVIKCPGCGSDRYRRSHRRGLERLGHREFLVCGSCRHRYQDPRFRDKPLCWRCGWEILRERPRGPIGKLLRQIGFTVYRCRQCQAMRYRI